MRSVVFSIKGDLGAVVFEDILKEVAVLLEEEDGVFKEDSKFWFILT
jgi:hypothetical protein